MEWFTTDIFTQFDKKWALLCAGTKEHHNTMTISWGGMGTLWSKPVVTVYVKPNRYTYGFMNDNDYFTISFYPEQYRKAMAVMGSVSGRDTNKDEAAGLTPKAAGQVTTYEEAEVTIICRKIYWQDLIRSNIPKEAVEKFYTKERPHRMFVGEVVEIINK